MAPSTELFLLLRCGSGSGMSSDRTGVAPAAEVVVIVHRLWCLRWLRFRRCCSGRRCRVRLCPSIVVSPWVAVGSGNRQRVHAKCVVLRLCGCWGGSNGRHALLPRWREVLGPPLSELFCVVAVGEARLEKDEAVGKGGDCIPPKKFELICGFGAAACGCGCGFGADVVRGGDCMPPKLL
jgi:hypothetical protein